MSASRARNWFVATFVSRSLTKRDYRLDVFRGLSIIGITIVNHAPPADEMYAPLVHAPWRGWTLAGHLEEPTRAGRLVDGATGQLPILKHVQQPGFHPRSLQAHQTAVVVVARQVHQRLDVAHPMLPW